MRRLLRAYVAVSCISFGVLLSGGAALSVLSWLSPGLVNAAWARAAQLTGEPARGTTAVPVGTAPIEPSQHSLTQQPAGGLAAAPAAVKSERGAVETEKTEKKDGWIDIGALEARLMLLDRTVPPWSLDASAVGSVHVARDARLEAWESVRKPLFGFLNAATGVSSRESRSFPENAAIESIAPEVASCLDALNAEYAAGGSKLLKNLEPSSIARLLADEKAVTEDRARRIFARLSGGDATAVMEKLSRLAPGRAARLLERLTWTKDEVDG